MAGTARMYCAPIIRFVRVICSDPGVGPTLILKIFQLAVDGVLGPVCHSGDCHYAEGNYEAVRRMVF